MYAYSLNDQQLVNERVDQFRDQTRRFLAGQLSAESFRSLRLMNGLYLQRHAPMLRVAIPYGLLSSKQLHKLADISTKYDKNYAHLTTRQNIQYNWLKLEEVPDLLSELAEVQMHGIQTSGSCIRNTTADHLAGAAPNEIEDPRPYCEIIRQWSTLHPEFSFLPRKFKIAVTGSEHDRAATQVHDIGIQIIKHNDEIGFKIWVGGGLGRTPVIGKVIREFLPREDLLNYLEAILRIYNQAGRRDNKYKSRIKILVNSLGILKFKTLVETEWEALSVNSPVLDKNTIKSMQDQFQLTYESVENNPEVTPLEDDNFAYRLWYKQNTQAHKVGGYRIVTLSVKSPGKAPGDLTDDQMHGVAALASEFSLGQIRVSHEQNLILAEVKTSELPSLWRALIQLDLATPNIGTLTDVICCPGLDFCSLANASSLSIVDQINEQFDDIDYLHDLGEIKLKISGCMNACGHHHVGHIGILGVDKKGEEWYQITLGGSAETQASLGKIIGPAIAKAKVASTIQVILNTYVSLRNCDETFLELVQRLGIKPFKEAVYV